MEDQLENICREIEHFERMLSTQLEFESRKYQPEVVSANGPPSNSSNDYGNSNSESDGLNACISRASGIYRRSTRLAAPFHKLRVFKAGCKSRQPLRPRTSAMRRRITMYNSASHQAFRSMLLWHLSSSRAQIYRLPLSHPMRWKKSTRGHRSGNTNACTRTLRAGELSSGTSSMLTRVWVLPISLGSSSQEFGQKTPETLIMCTIVS
ncbi:hypothetical protein LB505_007390 [Fusarium chuoi]|nr:hypothetical protein LB505_007390 [Fusarium chuoi]